MKSKKIDDTELIRLVDEGKSQADAARDLGVSRQAVSKRLIELRGKTTKANHKLMDKRSENARGSTPQEQIAKLQKDPKTGQFLPGNCLASKNAYYHDPKVMEAAIEDYFLICEEKEQPPIVTGLALHLGFTGRNALLNYLNRPGRSPFVGVIKRAKSRIEVHRVTSMLTNKNNVIGSIFDLKCNFNYIDKQVIESSVKIEQSFTPEDREALKALALQMIEAREAESDDSNTLLIEAESVSREPDLVGISDGDS